MIKNFFSSIYFQVILLGGIAFFITQRFVENWTAIKGYMEGANYIFLVLAFIIMVLSLLLLPMGMYFFLKGARQKVSYFISMRAFFSSQLTKYLPGALWVYPSRVLILSQLGVDAKFSSVGLLFESLTMLFSALVVGILAFVGASISTGIYQNLFLILFVLSFSACLLLVVTPNIVLRIFRKPNSVTEFVEKFVKISLRTRLKITFSSIAVFSVLWVGIGLSYFSILHSLDPQLDYSFLPTAIGVFAFSWAVGFITIFSPGGIGVREGMIVVLMGQFIAEPIPLISALISRLFWLALEISFSLLTSIKSKKEKNIEYSDVQEGLNS